MSQSIQKALDRRTNMSPHSPSRHRSSPTKKLPSNNKKAMTRLTSDAVQSLHIHIQHIFAKALLLEPSDPIAYVADQIRQAGLEIAAKKQSYKLPPVRPIESNTNKNPRHNVHR